MNKQLVSKLGDHISVKHGFAFKGTHFTEEVKRDVLLTPGNFAIGGGFQEAKPKYYIGPVPDGYILHPGDLVVTMTDLSRGADTLGSPALIPASGDRRYLHNQRVGLVCIDDESRLDKHYLYYLLQTTEYRHHVLATASGSTVHHTSPSRICDFAVSLPPISEQREISATLRALDDKIRHNRRVAHLLEALADAIYRAWFVDFEPVKAKVSGAKSYPTVPEAVFDLLPVGFVDSGIGPVPAGWDVQPLGERVRLTMGQSPPSVSYNENNEGLPFHQGVRNYGFRFPFHRIYCTAPGRIAERRDILLSVRAPVSRLNVADRRLILGRGLSGLRDQRGRQSFLLYQLHHVFRQEDALGDGTIYRGTTKRVLEQMRILDPPDPVQDAFEALARPMDELIFTFEAESKRLAEVRGLLLPKLLAREASVQDVDAELPS